MQKNNVLCKGQLYSLRRWSLHVLAITTTNNTDWAGVYVSTDIFCSNLPTKLLHENWSYIATADLKHTDCLQSMWIHCNTNFMQFFYFSICALWILILPAIYYLIQIYLSGAEMNNSSSSFKNLLKALQHKWHQCRHYINMINYCVPITDMYT